MTFQAFALRHWRRRARAQNLSFRNYLWWQIYSSNSADNKKNIYRSGGGKRCIFTKLEMFKYIKLYYNSEMIEHLKMILIHLFLQRFQCFWVHIPVKFLESKDKGYLEFK